MPDSKAGDDVVDELEMPVPWEEAPHTLPNVTSNGGPVLGTPELVTITYADDANRANAEAIGAFLVQSQWLAAVGKEYGIGTASTTNVELSDDAPRTIDDTAVQSLIAGLITAGTAPHPVDPSGIPQGVYMLYVPASTSVTVQGETLCQVSAGGYHYESTDAVLGHTFAYAVVSPCPGAPVPPPQDLMWDASHELIEAATDPFPLSAPAYAIVNPSQVESTIGGEVGDLCTYVMPQWTEGTWTAIQRVYSNAAAQSGGAPCAPSVGPYFAADVEPQALVPLPGGQTTMFQVTGWSTASVPAWGLEVMLLPLLGSAQPTVSVGSQLQNGQKTTMTVTMPPGAASGSYVDILLLSASGPEYTSALAGVYVP
jgi:hypothetical protein